MPQPPSSRVRAVRAWSAISAFPSINSSCVFLACRRANSVLYAFNPSKCLFYRFCCCCCCRRDYAFHHHPSIPRRYRICLTKRNTGMRPASLAIDAVNRWSINNSAQKPKRFTAATAMTHNSHHVAMAVARYSVLVRIHHIQHIQRYIFVVFVLRRLCVRGCRPSNISSPPSPLSVSLTHTHTDAFGAASFPLYAGNILRRQLYRPFCFCLAHFFVLLCIIVSILCLAIAWVSHIHNIRQ